MGFNQKREEVFEAVDACFFSSDMLYIKEERAAAKEYLARWRRAIKEHEDAECKENGVVAANDTLPVPRIEIYQYSGYNGGFAVSQKLLWRCDIVDVKGLRSFGGGSERSGYGYNEFDPAERDAKQWSERTGWPVFNLGRQKCQDEPLRR